MVTGLKHHPPTERFSASMKKVTFTIDAFPRCIETRRSTLLIESKHSLFAIKRDSECHRVIFAERREDSERVRCSLLIKCYFYKAMPDSIIRTSLFTVGWSDPPFDRNRTRAGMSSRDAPPP